MMTSPKRILLVEDEQPISETLIDLLQHGGYMIKPAPEGRKAVEILKLFRPHLIISDIMMPGMDGIQLLEQLKSDPEWNHIPVILLTAKKEIEDRLAGLQSGADAYLAKPFNIHELLLTIQNLLQLKTNILKGSFLQLEQAEETSKEISFAQQLAEYLTIHLNDPQLDLNTVAAHLSLSTSGLKKKLKKTTGKSFRNFLREFRLIRSREYLSGREHNVSEVARMTGFRSTAHFSDAFKQFYGCSPSNVLK